MKFHHIFVKTLCKSKVMKKIRLHPDFMNQIAREEGVTLQTVRMALYYVFNSDTSKRIRARAKELMIEEAGQIKTSIED